MMKLPEEIYQVYKNAVCLYDKLHIEEALKKVAQEIQYKIEDKNPIMLVVLSGGLVVAANLLMHFNFPVELDFVHVSRYRGSTQGSELVWKSKPVGQMQDRFVLIVDDILDRGLTLSEIVRYCRAEGAAEIQTAVLMDKMVERLPEGLAKANYYALQVEDHYVFGFGMDYQEHLRNAPGIYAVRTI